MRSAAQLGSVAPSGAARHRLERSAAEPRTHPRSATTGAMPKRSVWRTPEPRSDSRGAKAHLAETQFSRGCAAGDAHDSAQGEREGRR